MKMKNIMLVFILLFSCISLMAQQYDDKNGGGIPDPQLSQEDNDYLDRQANVFLDSVLSVIAKYPPSANENRERALPNCFWMPFFTNIMQLSENLFKHIFITESGR
jgi:hypothetical protein